MSMFSSLDALEADTNAASAPRAAVFQPKVKPRARKGGASGDVRSAAPKPAPAPRDRASTVVVDPSPIATNADIVRASETSFEASGLQSPLQAIVQNVVDVRNDIDEQCFAQEGDLTPVTSVVASLQSNASSVHAAAPPESVAQSDNLSSGETLRVEDERPPVAIRSNFPAPPTPTTRSPSRGEEVGLAARSSPEPGARVITSSQRSVSRDSEESDLLDVINPNSALNPTFTEGEVAGSQTPVTDPTPPFNDGDEDRRVADAEVEVQADEAEPVSEGLPGKRRRKRAFSHSTSAPRANRKEKEDVAPKIDFSKTDLSNPGKLTMREIIRRAEAIERKKMKVDVTAKKSSKNDGTQKQAAIEDSPRRDAVSMAPKVQVINGRIVIDEQSLTIGAYASTRLNTETYTRVEENASRLNYNSYSNRKPTERWKADDTEVFYRALKQFGTDFELIQNLFPGRTRRQVKAKFKKEERNNPKKLQEALAHRPKDQVHYTDMITRLKADEPAPNADDPFASILAYANDAAASEHTEIV